MNIRNIFKGMISVLSGLVITKAVEDAQPKDNRVEMYRRGAPAAWKEQLDEIIADRNPSKRP